MALQLCRCCSKADTIWYETDERLIDCMIVWHLSQLHTCAVRLPIRSSIALALQCKYPHTGNVLFILHCKLYFDTFCIWRWNSIHGAQSRGAFPSKATFELSYENVHGGFLINYFLARLLERVVNYCVEASKFASVTLLRIWWFGEVHRRF